MIIRNFTNMAIEKHKIKLGLKGDVYVYNGINIESLESHKQLYPDSTATTIEEAYAERVAFEERAKAAALEKMREETENGES